jgi:hypothetical protein
MRAATPPPDRTSRTPEVPWYLQPPDRSTPRPPAPESRPPAPKPQDKSRKHLVPWLLLGVGAAAFLTAAAVLIASLSPGGTGGTALDVRAVQNGVLQTLSDPAGGYGANSVSDVSCNGGRNPSAAKGTTFVCNAIVNGAQRQISVIVSDEAGTYEIDRPR